MANPVFIALERISMVEPWEAVLFPVEDFPVTSQELRALRKIWLSLRTAWIDKHSLSSDVLIHAARLERKGAERFREYARAWMPEPGLGVWPDRSPPTLPAQADLANLAPGERLLRPPAEQVLRVTGPPPAKRHALDIMLGFGVIVEVVTPSDIQFFEQARAALLPPIQERALRSFPLYAPLLERKSVEGASSQQLDKWFCGATAYLRESIEDKGVLIASREPLTPILQELGGHLEREPAPVWRLPIGAQIPPRDR